MKILLDTNVVIHRETSSIVRQDIGLLFSWIDKLRHEKYIHGVTKNELNKHKNSATRETMAVKLQSYNELKTLAPTSLEIEQIRGDDTSENDKNDTLLINEVFAGRVAWLITEDKAIHKKAEILGIQCQVFTIEDFLSKVIAENPDLTDYKVLSVRKSLFGDLNIDDPFFDSFKKDYKWFQVWFNGKAEKTSYVSKDENDNIVAFLYLKPEDESENYSDITPAFSKKKRLKIGTFKVINTGYKLGERFLKIVFDNALENQVDEIYVTIFEVTDENLSLISLLKTWGFVFDGEKKSVSGTEKVYIKDFSKKTDDNIKFSYPFISNKQPKFIVPIRPDYHTELFPDSILSSENPENFLENKGHRNAIQKVYISRSWEKDMQPKDIVLFYRTGGRYISVVTTIGIIESVVDNIRDAKTFIALCKKRSVFSDQELLVWWGEDPKNRPFIVNFLYVYSLPIPYLNLDRLIELGIIRDIKSPPRGFTRLSDEHFNLIMEKSDANKNFIVD